MFKSSRGQRSLTAGIFAAGVAMMCSVPPASAQYYNNWMYLPLSLGSYFMYPLRNMMYMPYNYTPYMVNNAMLQGGYSGYGRFLGNPSAPMVTQQYQDNEPIADPRVRTRSVRTNQGGHDVISHANWANSNRQSPNQPGNANGQMPPTAPQRGAAPSTPLADGFIKSVNEKYDGDISKALFDPSTRGYARALGLINDDSMFNADFSQDRIEVMRKIMHDSSLDPVSKLDTLRILLHNSSVASK